MLDLGTAGFEKATKSKAARARAVSWLAMIVMVFTTGSPIQAKDKKPHAVTVPVLELDGGRRLVFEREFSSEREVETKRGFWKRVVDVVAGAPNFKVMKRPYGIVTDSKGRVLVTDPDAGGVHIFDFKQQKYKFITRREKSKEAMNSPQCIAVDAQDNIYVTDSELGRVFVFEPGGKFQRVIGSLKYGEGYFKRPTGIAVDSAAQRIYVTDTLRNQIFVMDMQGNVLQRIGKSGSGNAEFNFPTELRLSGDKLLVVDALNFRVQVLDRSGNFQYAIGKLGSERGMMFRPKGVGMDSEGHLYVVDALNDIVQVFNQEGQLLYYFGQKGTGFGDFQLPTGLYIDRGDKLYVVDGYNHRVEVFQYNAAPKQTKGEAR
jgi:DNA-binding beta-propeller fold protein YncE